MSKTFKMVTIVGTSTESFDQAVENGLADAARSLRHLSWLEVQEQRGRIEDGKIAEYQVKLQIGLRVEH